MELTALVACVCLFDTDSVLFLIDVAEACTSDLYCSNCLPEAAGLPMIATALT